MLTEGQEQHLDRCPRYDCRTCLAIIRQAERNGTATTAELVAEVVAELRDAGVRLP